MASIILDSSDDDIPDTPENFNIRTMPKTHHLEGKANQFVDSPSVIAESELDDSNQQSKGKNFSISGLEDSLVLNSTVNMDSQKIFSKRGIVSDSFDANFSLKKPSVQKPFNGSLSEDGSPIMLSKKSHRGRKAIISSDSSDDEDDDIETGSSSSELLKSRGAQVSLSDSEVDEGELKKMNLEEKSTSIKGSSEKLDQSSTTNSQESEEESSDFSDDEDSDFVPSPGITNKKYRPKIVSSESDDSIDSTKEKHKIKSKPKADSVTSEDNDFGNSQTTDRSQDSFDQVHPGDFSNSSSKMSTSVQSNTSTNSEILSPFDLKKKYSDREVAQLHSHLNGIKQKIQQNERLLATLRNLPDNGSKIKAVISKLKDSESELVARILHARENMTLKESIGSQSVTTDTTAESELESLKVKEKVLRQKFGTTRLELLPDKGLSIRQELKECRDKIATLENQIKRSKPSPGQQKQSILLNEVPGASGFSRVPGYATIPKIMDERLFADAPAASQLYGGRIDQARRIEIGAITQEVLKSLHDCLKEMPTEKDEETDPRSLKKNIHLFPHQRQALAWMIWRESKTPPGGILADDMGLGKTLTLIALIAKHKEIASNQEDNEADKENKWLEKFSKNLIKSSATLVICPASLIGHWEKEVSDKLKTGTLKSLIYHGTNRGQSAKGLAKYDIIITTYGTVMSEMKGVLAKTKESKLEEMSGTSDDVVIEKNVQLLSIVWERIILDEAHQIRNPKSQTALAVCKLRAARRWAVTGTPIQNKELDMYSLVRFLRLRPFDEYRAWKVWVDNKTSLGQQRMNTLVRSMMLRRTKDQKSTSTGQELVSLPPKQILEHRIKLNAEERKVYDEVFSFSQQAMMNYMIKHQEKKEDDDYMKRVAEFGKSALPSFGTSTKATEVTNHIMPKSLGDNRDVKAHHILVLLLRLRQICCHPGLISSMLDSEAKANEGIEDQDGEELDLISQMADMSIRSSDLDNKETTSLLKKNPIFEESRESSKIATVISELKKLRDKNKESGEMEKAVIISQWTSMLGIVETHIKKLGMRCCAINGTIPVIKRGDIVNSFNRKNGGPQVMLLSLAAGGVGLNLVGANHLFMLDLHWNPQLEQQACDRIYRVGQEREVTIHKFLCEETVESRIIQLQAKKLELANGVLTGAQARGAGKLTFDDLRTLFNLGGQQD